MEQSSCSVSELVGGDEPELIHGGVVLELVHGGDVPELVHGGDGLRRELPLSAGTGGGREQPPGSGAGRRLSLGICLGGGRKQGVGTGGGLELPPLNPEKSSLARAKKSWSSMISLKCSTGLADFVLVPTEPVPAQRGHRVG